MVIRFDSGKNDDVVVGGKKPRCGRRRIREKRRCGREGGRKTGKNNDVCGGGDSGKNDDVFVGVDNDDVHPR